MAQPASGRLTPVLMIAAFLAVAGFLYWLTLVSEPTEIAVAQEEEDTALELGLETFQIRAEDIQGERVRLEEIEVGSMVGDGVFLFLLPEGTTYLVRFTPAVANNTRVVPQDRLTVTGTVLAMSDSVLDAWEAEGTLQDPAARGMVEVFVTFLEADRAEILIPTPGAEGDDEMDEGDGG